MISRSQHVLPRTVERFRHHACPNINFVKKCVPFHLWGCANYHSSSPTFDGMPVYHGTTILCVRKNGKVCMIGDGQVSKGSVQVKPNAKKIRVFDTREGVQKTLVGFAGATADAFALLDLLEKKIEEHPGQLVRSCVDLAKGWRTDKILRPLSASLLVADADVSLEVTGYGDVIEYNDGILGIGSGSDFAIAAARALIDIEELSAEEVATKAMKIASSMCVFTNDCYLIETLDCSTETISSESAKD